MLTYLRSKGFTLIEVMASLMIFAIGGTIALSFFSFHASSRIYLEEKIEAYQIADNVIKTLMLQKRTGKTIVTGTDDFKYPAGHEYKPGENVVQGHDDWKFAAVPVQQFEGTDANIPKVDSVTFTSTNNSYMIDPGDLSKSKYEYGYSIVDDPSSIIKYVRKEENFDSPDTVVAVDSNLDHLTVAVTWPSTNANPHERKRVLLSTVWWD